MPGKALTWDVDRDEEVKMEKCIWLITGVSSGFGYEITKKLLAKGEIVIGTVRNKDKVSELSDAQVTISLQQI